MKRTVPFNKITNLGLNAEFLAATFNYDKKYFFSEAKALLEKIYVNARVFLTKSCTDALELSGVVALKAGDEVILPSFGFVAISNAVAARGAKCVFVDIRKDTLNIDEKCIEAAITPKTKAIITMNYGGVACDYDSIMRITEKHRLILIEDNAQGIGAYYNNRPLGGFGALSTISFDSLKNVSCGQGGCLIVNDLGFLEAVKVAYEFGTNRLDFFEKKTDKYEWKSLGSNYALSEYLALLLYPQLNQLESITQTFLSHWQKYYQGFQRLAQKELADLPCIPHNCRHNGHIFHLRLKNAADRNKMIDFLKGKGITAQFHYTPLHLSEFGRKNSEFRGDDRNTIRESSRLVRLPMFHSITDEEIHYVLSSVYDFFGLKA